MNGISHMRGMLSKKFESQFRLQKIMRKIRATPSNPTKSRVAAEQYLLGGSGEDLRGRVEKTGGAAAEQRGRDDQSRWQWRRSKAGSGSRSKWLRRTAATKHARVDAYEDLARKYLEAHSRLMLEKKPSIAQESEHKRDQLNAQLDKISADLDAPQYPPRIVVLGGPRGFPARVSWPAVAGCVVQLGPTELFSRIVAAQLRGGGFFFSQCAPHLSAPQSCGCTVSSPPSRKKLKDLPVKRKAVCAGRNGKGSVVQGRLLLHHGALNFENLA